MNNVVLLPTRKLISHEQTDVNKVRALMGMLCKELVLKQPIVVDKKTLVILDGHHRREAFKRLGITMIPCLPLDYEDAKIKVVFRRPGIKEVLIKRIILNFALQGKVFPAKTTKHLIKERPRIRYRIRINKLGDTGIQARVNKT